MAQRQSNFAVLRVLLNGGDDSACDEDGITPLHKASLCGNLAEVRRLVGEGADIHAQDDGCCTPLFGAVLRGKLAVVKFLIDQEADVRVPDLNGKTILHWARNFEVANYLVETVGMAVNVYDKDGRTPLHEAANRGALDIARLLFDNGADVKPQNNNGWSALHIAARWGKLAMVKLLVSEGADVGAKTQDGETALKIAEVKGYSQVALFLKNVQAIKVMAGISSEMQQQLITALCLK